MLTDALSFRTKHLAFLEGSIDQEIKDNISRAS